MPDRAVRARGTAEYSFAMPDPAGKDSLHVIARTRPLSYERSSAGLHY